MKEMVSVLSEPEKKSANPLGYITYDDVGFQTSGKVQGITCYMSSAKEPPRGIYVQIGDSKGDVSFVGRILDGPFFTQNPGAFYLIELTSMLVGDHRTAVQTRPKPGSPVSILEPKEAQAYVGATGDFVLGRLIGQSEVEVAIESVVLNRHIGIFGTTGSGKSNSLQVIAEEASRSNMAVLIFDIEGEYANMNEPTDALLPILGKFGKKPEGIKKFKVYVPAPNTSRNIDPQKFGIPFADLDLEIFSEVLGLTPFERVYLFDIARKAKDISGAFRAYEIGTLIEVLKKRIDAQLDKNSFPEAVAEAHMGLYTKLTMAQRAGILDSHVAREVFDRLRPEDICSAGKVSVIDVSESSDIVRNICIAHLLKEIFNYKTRNLEAPPILIFMEEIHTFLSKAKTRTMMATLTMLTEMARKGRKRGIGLGIVSQQPALVPSELIELCNTRFMHRISSEANLNVLRKSTGNVPDSLWDLLPSLGNGEALISSPKFHHAIVAQLRPNMSKRLRVENS